MLIEVSDSITSFRLLIQCFIPLLVAEMAELESPGRVHNEIF